VVHLQGALGFGTCRQITDLVEDLAGGQGVAPTFGEEEESTLGRSKFVMVGPAKLARPLYIVVCLRNVTSLDYSAAQQLVKMKNAAVKSHQGSQGKHETVAHHIIYTRYRPEVKRTLVHCGCVNEGDEIVGDVAPGDLPCVALCGSYMRVLAICEDMLLYTATQRGLVSPQLPILPDHLPCAPGEGVRDGDVERQRDIDQGFASQYSVTSFCSESGHPAAFIRPEANAVSARELIAIVLGPYVGQGGQAVDNASSPEGGAPTPAGEAPMLSCPLPILSVELEVLLPLFRPRRLRYGEALWRRGDAARSMFIVHAGKLQVSLPKRNGMNASATTWSRVMSWHSRSESVSRVRNEARGIDARAVAPEQRSGEEVVDVAGPSSTLASSSTPSPSGGLDLSEEALVLEVLIPGSILGYLHAMSTPPQERFADVVVVSEWAAVLEFPLELLPELQATHPILAFGLMQCVLHRCTHEYNTMTQHQVNNDVDWVMSDE
jgi:CRP-like cAMP-binding protein